MPPEALLDVVWAVERYPEFVKGVKRVELREVGAREKLAEFTAGIAGMEFRYVLRCERGPEEVSWRRVSGSFKDAAGRVTHKGERRFEYENALDPGFALPEFAVRFVLERSLPRLIKEFRERARSLTRKEKR